MWEALNKYNFAATPAPRGEEGESGCSYKEVSYDISQLNEEHRIMLSSDEIFTAYLREISGKVQPAFYQTALTFIMLYRECLN